MKLGNTLLYSKRPPRLAIGLASAAVILSLAACGGDTLESIQNDLANGEDVNINLSTNDDGSLVVSIDDDDNAAPADDSDVRVVGAMYALTNQHDPSQQISAAADAASEPDRVNQVVAYTRSSDGSLQQIGVYDTGGVGENIRASGANPLASQDPLIVSKDQRFVFAVNAGSESISSFRINDDYSLTPASLDISTSGSSGAQNPVSLTIYENILYVANTGNFVDGNGIELDTLPEDRNRVNSSIIAFTIGDDGTLTELAGSEMPGMAPNAGSIEFSSDGRSLYITERRTDEIVAISLDENRLPVSDSVLSSITAQPFGTCLLYTSPSPRDATLSRMPSSA